MSGWGEWESTEWEQSTTAADSPRLQIVPSTPGEAEPNAAIAPGTGPETGTDGTPLSSVQRRHNGRRARRAQRRDLAAQRQVAHRTEQRRALDALGRASGLPAAIAAVVVFAVLVVVNVTGNDQKDTARSGQGAATGSGDASASRTGDTPPTTGAGAMTLDPHAGTKVLPPQALPAAAGVADIDATMPLAVAEAFAREACATTGTETATQYATRLASFATSDAAAAWPRGTGTKVRCLQFTAAPDPDRAASPTVMPVVVTAVQVYDTGGGAELVAYRWRATPTLTLAPGGTWQVSG